MDETKYVVLAQLYGVYVRGDIITAADLVVPPEEVIANGDIRVATPEEAALGHVPPEALEKAGEPPPQADSNAAAKFATLQPHIDAARAANPQKGAPPPPAEEPPPPPEGEGQTEGDAPPAEEPRAITDDAKTRRLSASEVKEG